MNPKLAPLLALGAALACVDIPDREPLRASENPGNASSGSGASSGTSSGSGGTTNPAGGATGSGGSGGGAGVTGGAGTSGGAGGSVVGSGGSGGTTTPDRCDDPLLIDDFEFNTPLTCQGGGCYVIASTDDDHDLVDHWAWDADHKYRGYETTAYAASEQQAGVGLRGAFFDAAVEGAVTFSNYVPYLTCNLIWKDASAADSDPQPSYDATAYAGISFLFKASIDCGDQAGVSCDRAWFGFTTIETLETDFGGECNNEEIDCFNEFGAWVTFTPDEWTPVTVLFDDVELQIPGGDDPSMGTLDLGRLVRVTFKLGHDVDLMTVSSVSFVVDNLRFVPK